jgi:hypothetical protein
MRRKYLWAGLLASAGAAAIIVSSFTSATSAPPGIPAPAEKTVSNLKQPGLQLPVSQVILYSSGVGFFQREGEVVDNTRVDLTFDVSDINDLLKSMVAQDLGGGSVSSVSYDSQDPIDKTLSSFAINLNGNPSFSGILNQARGEKVEVVMQQTTTTQPGTLTGSILGVERQKQAAGTNVLESEVLNLWCSEGIRAVKLNELQRVRFLNPVIENEMKRALETMAQSHDTQKKAVSVTFSGDGKRPVRLSYVTENPIWKTSYRLVLGKEGKPFLQGWAVVENTTDEDWSNVRMALVSGRPISFQMDLYQPLYIKRPTVDLELFASLRPVVYGGAMEKSDKSGLANNMNKLKEMEMDQARDQLARRRELMDGRPGGEAKGAAAPGAPPADRLASSFRKQMDLSQGVQSSASAGELGDFFQYIIQHPVSLARQKSAMLPVINESVMGSRVSIYNDRVQAKHPLLGLKFKNSSGLHLMQGPITVFEGAGYAGDARIADLQPNEERLLSYAIDLGTEVEPIAKRQPDRLVKVRVDRGLIYSTSKVREEKLYTIKNRSEHDRLVILEHPYRGTDFRLVAPEKFGERTRDLYRFEVPVKMGETVKHEVVEERDVVATVSISNTDDNTIKIFQQSPVVSEGVKKALSKAVEYRNELASQQRERQQQERELKILTDDQTRLRANIANLPQGSEAYKRYLKKFDEQEPMIEKYQEKIKELLQNEHKVRLEYEKYLTSLVIE